MMSRGGCACGAARYEVSGEPLVVHACHCEDCQRLSGSAFAVNAWFKASDINLLSGTLQARVLQAGSGKDHVVSSCEECGTQLWGEYAAAPAGAVFLRTGTLDNGYKLEPDVHVFTRSKLPWVVLPEGVPAFAEFYNPKKVWSAENLARMES